MKSYQPRCEIRIGIMGDIAKYLGDGGHVMTHKDLYAPVGKFEIAVPDKPYRDDSGNIQDSLYGLILPFDYTEIRMSRTGKRDNDNKLPIVMRGFVRSIIRDETMGADGHPQRMIIISGDDYGCFGELAQINMLGGAAMGQHVLPILRPAELGIDQSALPAAEFISVILENLINKQMAFLNWERWNTNAGSPTRIMLDATVNVGQVRVLQVFSSEGTAWRLMFDYADTPWNELFIEDREDGVYLVYRPTAWKDINGRQIDNMGQAWDAQKVTVVNTPAATSSGTKEQVIDLIRSVKYVRSDEQVYNIYWVEAKAMFLDSSPYLASVLRDNSIADVNQTEYVNCSVGTYGPRILQLPTVQAPIGTKIQKNINVNDRERNRSAIIDWQKQRIKWLAEANRDNVLFDSGSLVMRGDERVKVGGYFVIDRGKFLCDHYVTQVTHTFAPFREFTTEISFIRSTNFLKRRDAPTSPYLMEGRKGVYEKSSNTGLALDSIVSAVVNTVVDTIT